MEYDLCSMLDIIRDKIDWESGKISWNIYARAIIVILRSLSDRHFKSCIASQMLAHIVPNFETALKIEIHSKGYRVIQCKILRELLKIRQSFMSIFTETK